uniref:C-type lectin domain-containing protein n=1 Tax=Periophthalmus magnuspinnatus TaxID=409849 RepID=A0A3B4AD00_9GOBI
NCNTTRSSTRWMWSGGQEMLLTKGFWAPGEPNDWSNGEDHVAIRHDYYNYLWVDAPQYFGLAFLCYKVHAIRTRMTWYDALQYCRQNHQDLVSVASETEMMLIKHELSKELSSYNVWTGLQYLVDSWQWMDGQPFSYESWGPDPKPTYTLLNVTKLVGWNALNCNRKLHFLCY